MLASTPICPAAHDTTNTLGKDVAQARGPCGASPALGLSIQSCFWRTNKWQGPPRSGVTTMGVPPEELPADTEQPLVTLHGTGNKDFQGIGQNCLARGAAGCCDAPSPWTPKNGISQSHDRNFEAFSSCLSRFSPASPLLGTGSRAERKWEHDSHPHPGQLGLQGTRG